MPIYRFARNISSMTGKSFRAGFPVPDGFSTPAGLAEMLKAGDIELIAPASAPVQEAELVDIPQDGVILEPVKALTPKTPVKKPVAKAKPKKAG